jgi:large subunit ribosomal protein L15
MNKKVFQLVNIGQLTAFEAGTSLDAAALFAAGLIRNAVDPIKLLAAGEITVKLEVNVSAASASAIAKIEAAKGSVKLAEA